MNFGTAAEALAKRLNLANATAGTQNGVECRRHIIDAIKELSTVTFSFNMLVADAAITANLNDYTVGGSAGQALPSGTLCPVDLFWAIGTEGAPVIKASEVEMIHLEIGQPVSSQYPTHWSWKNNACHVYPVPTVNWTLRGIYLRNGRIADPTFSGSTWTFVADSTTSIWLEDDAVDVVINTAMANYYVFKGRPELAPVLRQMVSSKIIPAVAISQNKRGKPEVDSWL
jgi:hypothetical protein